MPARPTPPRPVTPGRPTGYAGHQPARPLIEHGESNEPEHRRFPRARIAVAFELSIPGPDGEPRFAAKLSSVNLSVSGAFLESSYFLPVGTRLHTVFLLDESGPAIEADAEIVRQERPDERDGSGRSGFAVRFLEFYGKTEVTLAKLFVGEQLRAFAEEYLESDRAKSLHSELDRVIDALAAWELQKVMSSQDLWAEE